MKKDSTSSVIKGEFISIAILGFIVGMIYIIQLLF